MEPGSTEPPDGDYHSGILWIISSAIFHAPSVEVFGALVATLILILCSALISGAEVAFFSLHHDNGDLRKRLSEKSANRIEKLLQKPGYLLATILVVNNLANVAIVIISYFIFSETFKIDSHPILEFVINVLGVSFFLVLFGEVLPKVYATKYNHRLAAFMAMPIIFLGKIFWPINYLLVTSTKLIEKRLQSSGNNSLKAEELERAIDLTTDTKTSSQEVNMLKGIVKFGNTMVKQIMKSRVDVVAISEEINYIELLDTIKQSGYSRIPVYKENLDNITGILYAKDLLQYLDCDEKFDWQQLIRQAEFTPENKKIDDLLKDIQNTGIHLVVVVDEYGGTSGIITLEDILEEVIGEIKDEYDLSSELEFEKLDAHNYVFEGKTLLKDICKVMHLKDDTFDEVKDEADSLAGLVLELSGKLPQQNEEFSHQNFIFTVVSLGKNRIRQVKITTIDEE